MSVAVVAPPLDAAACAPLVKALKAVLVHGLKGNRAVSSSTAGRRCKLDPRLGKHHLAVSKSSNQIGEKNVLSTFAFEL